jgi:Flp pilus assembly protein TadD
LTDLSHAQTVSLAALEPGRVLAGRFEIRALLGAGGMGAVYRARDRELEEDVALKTLRPELAASDATVARFRREVQLARRVTHPNVVRTYDLGNDGELRFATMELVEGAPLSFRASAALPLGEVLRVGAEIARGLAAAHVAGVVHRDLKPANVMLVGSRVAITDFGIARIAEHHEGPRAPLVTVDAILGTPAYMAPEQVEGAALDGRADVYALGVVLFELLTGALPFSGTSALAIAVARLTSAPPDPRSVDSTIPGNIAELVLAMLGRERAARPDAHTVLERMDRMLGRAPTARSVELSQGAVRDRGSGELDLATPLFEAGSVVLVGDLDGAGQADVMARDLTLALKDGISREAGVRLAAAGSGAATLTCDGSVRTQEDGRVRVRVRLLARSGEIAWATSVDGQARAQLDLEDQVVARVIGALRAHKEAASAPADPSLRPRFEEALALVDRVDLGAQQRGVELLERLLTAAPEDPAVLSQLSIGLSKLQRTTGATDPTAFARAEDLALRALASPRPPALAYHAMALIRAAHASYREMLLAELEALKRAPRLAEAHFMVGVILSQLGRTNEGLTRIHLAIRLDERLALAHAELAMISAITGERDAAEASLARAEAIEGRPMLNMRSRLAFIFRDRDFARETAAVFRAAPPKGAAWEGAALLLDAFATGEQVPAPMVRGVLEGVNKAAPRTRAIIQQVFVEYFCATGDERAAIDLLAQAAEGPGFVNLLWLDRCAPVAPLRALPEFAHARAVVAARVSDILGG